MRWGFFHGCWPSIAAKQSHQLVKSVLIAGGRHLSTLFEREGWYDSADNEVLWQVDVTTNDTTGVGVSWDSLADLSLIIAASVQIPLNRL